MPEKKTKKQSAGSKPKSKLITGSNVSWGASKKSSLKTTDERPDGFKREASFMGNIMQHYSKWIYGFGALLVVMFVLYFFVEDSAVAEHRRRMEAHMRQRREEARANVKEFAFDNAHLMNSSELTAVLQQSQTDEDWDRMVLAAFDDSTTESNGDPKKVKLFRKFESVAKSMPRRKLFKRYEEDELPFVLLFDCGNPEDPMAEQICQQLVGTQLPNVLIFRRGVKPRPLSSELRSDKAILQHLFDLMQPPVKYLEELSDVEDFVADDSSMKTVFFGPESESYDLVADTLREYGKFARTKNPVAAEDYGMELPSMAVWCTHGTENPLRFEGNISDPQSLHSFVVNNYLPLLGDFNEHTQKMYRKRGLPIVWLAHRKPGARSTAARREAESEADVEAAESVLDEEAAFEQLVRVTESAARQNLGHLVFVKLDVDYQPDLAKNLELIVDTPKPKKKAKKEGKESDEDEDDEEEEGVEAEDKDVDDDSEEESAEGSVEESNLPQLVLLHHVAQIHEEIDMSNIPEAFNNLLGKYYEGLRAEQAQNEEEEGDGEIDEEFLEADDEEDAEEETDEDDSETVEISDEKQEI